MKGTVLKTLYVVISICVVNADYDCVCNYAVEKAVYPDVDLKKSPIGYMYEFDCKPAAKDQGITDQQSLHAMQFEGQTGYIHSSETQIQICSGQPSPSDLVASTTAVPLTSPSTLPVIQSTKQPPTSRPTTVTTTKASTISVSTLKTIAPQAAKTTTTPPTTTKTTTPLPTTKTTTPLPTTKSTTPLPTTKTTTPLPTSRITTPLPTTKTTTTTTSAPTTTTTTTARPTTRTTTVPSTEAPTTEYAHWVMAANVTGTPYQYVGVGYNILTGNPDSDPDPGFITSSRVFQLTGDPTSTLKEATYHSNPTCVPNTQAFMIHGSKAYQQELLKYVMSDNMTASLMDAAFSFNIDFKGREHFVNDVTQVDNDVITTCKFGSVQYLYNSNNNPTVSRDFAASVCKLPPDFNSGRQAYMDFIEKWGTSISVSVDLGTRTMARYQTTPVDLFNHVKNKDPDYIQHGGAFAGYQSSVAIDTRNYTSSKASMSQIGTRHLVSVGTKSDQVPIKSHIVSITTALNMKYWQPILDELVLEGYCSDDIYVTGLTQYEHNLQTALNQYITFKKTSQGFTQATLLDRPFVQVPITWPAGTYGLMKAAQGCPAGHTHWSGGWRKFDTEDTDSHNYFSPNVNSYLSGSFHSNNIVTDFCGKIQRTSSSYDQQWPKGSYCILKYGPCPTGFWPGFIYWDNEDSDTSNGHGGSVPDGDYDANTKIYFCCRNDASPHESIFLPTDRPFVLSRYSNTCQAVHGMKLTNVFVRWDDEDTLNSSGSGGMHPSDTGGPDNHLLHFCHYAPVSSGINPALIG
ncbi:hypothetical protein ACF0H5_017765 [Mactra antiquata]